MSFIMCCVYFLVICLTVSQAVPFPSTSIPGTKTTTADLQVCNMSADVLFVIDGSGSIGYENFNIVQKFLENATQALSTVAPGTWFAAIQFSALNAQSGNYDEPQTEFSFSRFKDNFQNASRKALNYSLEHELTSKAGDRPDVPDLVVVITDGRSLDDVETPANNIREKNIQVIAIGVGNSTNYDELLLIAGGDNKSVIHVSDFAAFNRTVTQDMISRRTCTNVTHFTTTTSTNFTTTPTTTSTKTTTTPTTSSTTTSTSSTTASTTTSMSSTTASTTTSTSSTTVSTTTSTSSTTDSTTTSTSSTTASTTTSTSSATSSAMTSTISTSSATTPTTTSTSSETAKTEITTTDTIANITTDVFNSSEMTTNMGTTTGSVETSTKDPVTYVAAKQKGSKVNAATIAIPVVVIALIVATVIAGLAIAVRTGKIGFYNVARSAPTGAHITNADL